MKCCSPFSRSASWIMLWAYFTLFILHTEAARATFLQIRTEPKIEVDTAQKRIRIVVKLTNEGDEQANDVGVSFPSVNISSLAAAQLLPHASASSELVITFEKMKIELEGKYFIPFHVTYKDGNFYPYSAPQLLEVSVGESPATGLLSIILNDLPAGEALKISSKAHLSVSVYNVSGQSLNDLSFNTFASFEFRTKTDQNDKTFSLASSEFKTFDIEIENMRGVLGSQYPILMYVSGISGKKHFADYQMAALLITSPGMSSANVYLYLSYGLIFVVVIQFLLQRRRTLSTPPSAIP